MKRKAQVTVYIFSAIATLVIISFVIINIGKTAKDKTHADNAADAGALAACSTMATGFNYVADNNSKDPSKAGKNGMRTNSDEFADKSNPNATSPKFQMADNQHYNDIGVSTNGGINSSLGDPFSQAGAANSNRTKEGADLDANNKKFEQAMNDQHNSQNKQLNDTMNTLDNADNPAGQDYQNEAISMGYKICFQNSGTHHRLGKINSKRYEAFQKQLEPGMVQSGMPMTFFYVDGAARAHMVTCIINIEPADNASVKTQQDDHPTSTQKSQQEANNITNMNSASQTSEGGFITAQNPCTYLPGEAIGIGANGVAESNRSGGQSTNNSLNNGIQGTKTVQHHGSASTQQETPKNISDVNNSRTVSAANFQFHMGSPIKSINADIDMVTFYPPVQSTAIATFNYTGQGRVSDQSDEGGGQSARHECGLVGAF